MIRALWIHDGCPLAICAVTLLMKQGFHVELAKDARIGLVKARSLELDVIVLNTSIDLTALAIVRALRAESNETPVLILTDAGTADSAPAVPTAGATGDQSRPLVEADMVTTILRFVETEVPWAQRWRLLPRGSGARTTDLPDLPMALERWAWHVHRPCVVHRDPRTLVAWGNACGRIGETTLREISHGVGLDALASCRLARVMWVLDEHLRTGESVANLLGAADPRTLAHLLAAAGIIDPQHPPPLDECFRLQTLIAVEHPAIIALRRLLKAS